jgi:hypothetical protein
LVAAVAVSVAGIIAGCGGGSHRSALPTTTVPTTKLVTLTFVAGPGMWSKQHSDDTECLFGGIRFIPNEGFIAAGPSAATAVTIKDQTGRVVATDELTSRRGQVTHENGSDTCTGSMVVRVPATNTDYLTVTVNGHDSTVDARNPDIISAIHVTS